VPTFAPNKPEEEATQPAAEHGRVGDHQIRLPAIYFERDALLPGGI